MRRGVSAMRRGEDLQEKAEPSRTFSSPHIHETTDYVLLIKSTVSCVSQIVSKASHTISIYTLRLFTERPDGMRISAEL